MTERFGDYLLVREIGHGSSARVHLARRKGGPDVALKIFDRGAASEDAVLNFFQNELTVVRSLNHPNIVRYIDAGVINGVPYIAMDLLKDSLEARVQRNDFLAVEDVVSILMPLAGALDYAHSQRILHRDIKPSNILFAADGRPVLSDFGIARFAPSREAATTGRVLVVQRRAPQPAAVDHFGTSDFMAPEVMLEAPASPASDIYSLGMTVYYSLCGILPTDRMTVFTRSRDRIEGKLVPLAVRNPNIPGAVSDVVLRALQSEPRRRFATASAFASAVMIAAGDTAGRLTPTAAVAAVPKTNWLDYWRYIVVPLLIALIGAVAAWLTKK